MKLDLNLATDYLLSNGTTIAVKFIVAIAAWIIGRWLIKLVRQVLTRLLISNEKVDTTIAKYITSFLSGLLSIGLAIAILSYLGVQTTSLAALLAGIGLAIGTAWGGLLTHFSAGIFLQILRPFKIGDYVDVGGVEGDVLELGLFGTTVLSVDNVTTIVGNSKVFSEIIRNYSNQPYRRANCVVLIDHSVPIAEAIEQLRVALKTVPNVLEIPAPQIGVLDITKEGVSLAIRPFCHTAHHMYLRFATYQMIQEVFKQSGYLAPNTRIEYREKD
jgi:small conductance mechanosensitive channel